MTRKPTVSGQFYPADRTVLDKQIKSCFLDRRGPGMVSQKHTKNIISVISPHAGYMYSGMAAAWAYKEVAESPVPDLYIMLGLGHSGQYTCVSGEDWMTPKGIVKTDSDFVAEIARSGIPVDDNAHASEHSIEVQLPFLQFVKETHTKELTIAAIICSPDMEYRRIAHIIHETLTKQGKKAIIVTSSDFTHYGYNYGYMPFRDKVKENMYALDKEAISFIEKLDSSGFLEHVQKTGTTICGQYPIAVSIELSRLLGAKKGKLLQYYTSGDIVNNYDSAVGYAAIVIR